MRTVKTSSDGRRLLYQVRNVRRTVLDSLSHKKLSPKELRVIRDIPRILKECDRSQDEISTAKSVLVALKETGEMSADEVMALETLIVRCEEDLGSFIRDVSGTELQVVAALQPKEEVYLEELQQMSMEAPEKPSEKTVDIAKELIYTRPGLYVDQIHKNLVSENMMDITYQAIWSAVGRLVDMGDIVTLGGPQGRLRYCFPNPQRIGDREMYYGLPFAVLGEIEEKVTDSWTQNPLDTFKDIFVVETTASTKALLIVGCNRTPDLGPGREITSFGKLETVDYLLSYEGFEPCNGSDEIQDALLALKVDMKVNGEEKEIWFDERISKKKSLYA